MMFLMSISLDCGSCFAHFLLYVNLKILEYKPKVVCFNGKNAAKAYLNQKTVKYGHQSKNINTTKIFVAPSTSGAANGFWNKKIWEEILNFI